MTHHYINLISWSFFVEKKKNCKIHIDSLSLKLLLFLFGKVRPRKSGLSTFRKSPEMIYLLADSDVKLVPNFILPYWKSKSDIKISNELSSFLKKSDSIVIGISSPKQDILARLIHNKYPQKSIYCFGAALYTKSNRVSDKYGFNWLLLLIFKPKRTIKKIYQTMIAILCIFFQRSTRKKFQSFADSI